MRRLDMLSKWSSIILSVSIILFAPLTLVCLIFRFVVPNPQSPDILIEYAFDIVNTDTIFLKTWAVFSNNLSWLFFPALTSLISAFTLYLFVLIPRKHILLSKPKDGLLAIFVGISILPFAINAMGLFLSVFNGENINYTLKIWLKSPFITSEMCNIDSVGFLIYSLITYSYSLYALSTVRFHTKSILLTFMLYLISTPIVLVILTILLCSSYLLFSYLIKTMFISLLMFVFIAVFLGILGSLGTVGMGVATAAFSKDAGLIGVSALDPDNKSDRVALEIISYDNSVEGIHAGEKVDTWSKAKNNH